MFVCTTSGSTMRAEIKWIIHNYDLQWPRTTSTLDSHLFHAENDEDVKWRIKISPKEGLYSSRDSHSWNLGYANFCVNLEASPASQPTIVAKFSVTIYDETTGKKLRYGLGKATRTSEPYAFNLTERRQQKLTIGSRITACQILSIRCNVEYEISSMTTSSKLNVLPIKDTSLESSGMQDLSKLFPNHQSSDVCFVTTDGQEFKAHKLILSARSPVFAGMFNARMKENLLDRVDIQDIESVIFEALLRFVYTDQVDLIKINAKKLLIAANRYLIPLLKLRCEAFLAESLTIENCTEIIALADLHNAQQLKKMTTEFIYLRKTEVRKTEGWKTLKQTRPDIALDIFETCYW